jgi:hypothetical protein
MAKAKKKAPAKKKGKAPLDQKTLPGVPVETPAEKTGKFWPESNQGRKQCPECKMYVPSAHKGKKCNNPDCNYIFPAKSKTAKPAKTTGAKRGRKPKTEAPTDSTAKLAAISAAVQLVEKLGGVEKAKEKLATVRDVLGVEP